MARGEHQGDGDSPKHQRGSLWMSLGQPRGSSSSSLLDVHINCGAKKGKGDVKADLARGDQGEKPLWV